MYKNILENELQFNCKVEQYLDRAISICDYSFSKTDIKSINDDIMKICPDCPIIIENIFDLNEDDRYVTVIYTANENIKNFKTLSELNDYITKNDIYEEYTQAILEIIVTYNIKHNYDEDDDYEDDCYYGDDD